MRVIGQGTAAVAGLALAELLDTLADGTLDVDQITATELSGFDLRLDMSDTLDRRRQPERDDHRHQPHRRPRPPARRHRARHRQPAQQRPHRQGRRGDLHERRPRRGDERRLDQGVLRPGRRRRPAGLRDHRGRRDRHRPGAATSCSPRCARCRRRCARCSTVGRPSPRRRGASPRSGATGRSSATAPTWSRPTRCGSSSRELCYKSIACDVTEDKKHIDLSSEPLILVCAAGLSGGTADDVAKEVAIYKAHKATPIVIATEGDERFAAASAVISVPAVHPALAFVLSAMVGHLFGYEAALAIDALGPSAARGARADRGRAEASRSTVTTCSVGCAPASGRTATGSTTGCAPGCTTGTSRRPPRCASAGCCATSPASRRSRATSRSSGKIATPSALIDDLTAALTRTIEELTRPVDAIKHQAKTVTVGISRNDEGVLDRVLVQAVLNAGAGRDRLSYRTLKVLADLDPAVESVVGFTRYRIDGEPSQADATIGIVDRGGLSLEVPSRVETQLAAARHEAARRRRARGARGPRPQGRAHVDLRAGGQGLGVHRHHAAARALPRSAPGDDDARRAAGLRPALRPAGRLGGGDRGQLPRRPARRGARRRSAHRADVGDRRPLAFVSPTPHGRVIGVGVDAVDIERFRVSLARTPSMRTRLFTAEELAYVAPKSDPVPSLAARFAAREAVMKAMGLGLGAFGFHEAWVTRAPSGEPSLVITGRAAELAAERGITEWLLSITHTDLVAIAHVVAQ